MNEQKEHTILNIGEIPCQEISDSAVMSKEPLVSVKMITYNHEPFIAQAIEGVLMQECDFPIELIIGEDCSTDRTREIVLEYQKKYPNVIRVIISEKNVGQKKNGLRTHYACRGKYMAICEGDDYWTDPLKLQKQVDILESNPHFSACFTNGEILNERLGIITGIRYSKMDHDEFSLDGHREGMMGIMCTYMFRHEVIYHLPEYFLDLPGGHTLFILLSARHGKIKYLNTITAVYRVHSGGVWSGSSQEEKLKTAMRVHQVLLQNFDSNYKDYFLEKIAICYYNFAVFYLQSGDIRKSLINIWCALTTDFTVVLKLVINNLPRAGKKVLRLLINR